MSPSRLVPGPTAKSTFEIKGTHPAHRRYLNLPAGDEFLIGYRDRAANLDQGPS